MFRANRTSYQSLITKLGVGFDPVLDIVKAFDDSVSLDDLTKIPPYNIKRTSETEYAIELELPGVKKEDIDLTLDSDYLTVAAEVEGLDDDPEGDDVYFHRGIYEGGKFEAKFIVARNLNFTEAKLENGILTVKFADQNVKRELTTLAIGPFPKPDVQYKVVYNNAGSPVAVPVDADASSPDAVAVHETPVAPPVETPVVETPAASVSEGDTHSVVVDSTNTNTPTTTVVLPTELPHVVEASISDIAPSLNTTNPAPQATISVVDSTYEVADDAKLTKIATPAGTSDVVVSVPPEVQAVADANGIDIPKAVEKAVAAAVVPADEPAPVAAPEIVVPAEAPVATVTVDPIVSENNNNKATDLTPPVTVDVPAVVTPVVTVTANHDTTEANPTLTVAPHSDETIPADAKLVPIITPEGQPDIVAAVSPELHDNLTQAGVDVAAAVSDAVQQANVVVATPENPTPEPAEPAPEATHVEVPVSVPAPDAPTSDAVTVAVPVAPTPVMTANVTTSDDTGTTITLQPAASVPEDSTLVHVETPDDQPNATVAVHEDAVAAIEAAGKNVSAVINDTIAAANVVVTAPEPPAAPVVVDVPPAVDNSAPAVDSAPESVASEASETAVSVSDVPPHIASDADPSDTAVSPPSDEPVKEVDASESDATVTPAEPVDLPSSTDEHTS